MIDEDAAKMEVLDHLQGLIAAENKSDVEGALGFYADDVYLVAPGLDVISGKDAFRGILGPALAGDIVNSHEYIDVQFSDEGDLCFVVGKYSLTTDDPGFDFPTSGKMVLILRKTNGEWRIAVNCFNN